MHSRLGPGDDRRLAAQVLALGGIRAAHRPVAAARCSAIIDADPVVATTASLGGEVPGKTSRWCRPSRPRWRDPPPPQRPPTPWRGPAHRRWPW